MANTDDEELSGEAFLPITKADTAMEVIDRMKREEDSITAEAALRFMPRRTLDLSRAPGQPMPAPSPAVLAPVTIRTPQATYDQGFDPYWSAQRYNVPIETAIKAEAARRQFEAQQRIAAAGYTPEAMSRYGMFAFPTTTARGVQSQIRAVPRGSDLVAYSPFGGAQTIRPAQAPAPAQVSYNELSDGSLDIQTTQPTGHVTHHVIRKGQSTLEKAAWLDLQNAIKADDQEKIRDTIAYIDSLNARRPSIPTRVGAPAGTAPAAGAPRSFATEAEALASGVKGIVIINGRRAKID